jgi:hypothetical protein
MDTSTDTSTDMDSSTDTSMDSDSAATIAFQLNTYNGSIAVTSPIQLKEFLLAPTIHQVDECVLSISQAQVWEAFETAGFNIEHGFVNSSQLFRWLFCKYKIPTNTTNIPTTAANQKRVFNNYFDKY